MQEKKRRSCKECGYKWSSRVKLPKECPKCKTRDWEDDKGDDN